MIRRNDWLVRKLYAGLVDETDSRRNASAIVFAPHPDDETLGCAGTILLKRQAGARVVCVFMTDGSTSHSNLISAVELGQLRNAEARLATRNLDVDPEEIHFLGFPDGHLSSQSVAATARVRAILEQVRPMEVYVPYRRDRLADHEATYAIVVRACMKAGIEVDVCEYPIWAWNRWPWVSLEIRFSRMSARTLPRFLMSGLGLRMLQDFRTGIRIEGVKQRKYRALSSYRSQMEAPDGQPDWPTLRGVSGGTFLECFLGDFEVFRCARLETGMNRT